MRLAPCGNDSLCGDRGLHWRTLSLSHCAGLFPICSAAVCKIQSHRVLLTVTLRFNILVQVKAIFWIPLAFDVLQALPDTVGIGLPDAVFTFLAQKINIDPLGEWLRAFVKLPGPLQAGFVILLLPPAGMKVENKRWTAVGKSCLSFLGRFYLSQRA